jgi:predicted transcriptional regulator
MARPPSQYPTGLELEILKILWRDGESPVRHVRDALASFRDLAYTSVMTTMSIMKKKGYLKRRRAGKSFYYSPLVTEEETSRGMLSDLVERVFDGSARALMVNLLEAEGIAGGEIEELRALINEKAREAAKGRAKGVGK